MKHLIYLIDGTGIYPGKREPDSVFSNIHLINNYLDYSDEKGNPQIVHYKRGIGSTRPGEDGWKSRLERMRGLGIWNDIEELYINICSNYEPGDKIYLLGYSRGAIVAAAIAQLIEAGILPTNKLDDVPEAIRLVRLIFQLNSQKQMLSKEQKARVQRFQEKCIDKKLVSVEFLGLFDAVTGGARFARELQELAIMCKRLPKCVQNSFHLVAIDESRNIFEPTIFEESRNLEQIWFPGVHCDVGGGSPQNHLSNIALLTMIDRLCHHTELQIDYEPILQECRKQTPHTVVNNEWDTFWRIACWINGLGNRHHKRWQHAEIKDIHPIAIQMTKNNLIYRTQEMSAYQHELEGVKETPGFLKINGAGIEV